ncbi:DNA-directed RNA polymerase subunit omega [Oribacterium sp. NK2B42]|uniref:DNA-directed RNA polymerase subunit omega n=1 Tax=Oribacterium sp. NK2B42 TaxID=689781 RepID=UPI0003F923C8|nr:DNA-directed RNA polymerase subunit omega [Oribacterium sp. NK2B42]MBO5597769.1 DNA-directed RNA polymerase subunit omega [Oribacterium sp.]MBP3805016.1 DNA-directed RNA polymerase subunit omega [Oribacterium sp.]MBR1856293.1 DNA-directed RNA polymerase subunit omega [Oribacterium sp.]
MSQQTYNDLIDAANNTNAIQDDTDKLVESRYSVVIASAKRARQLIDGAEPVLPVDPGRKPLSIAVEELAKNAITIKRGAEVEDEIRTNAVEKRFDFATEEYDEEDDGTSEIIDNSPSASSEDDYNSDSEA